jgi:hypothetical protein
MNILFAGNAQSSSNRAKITFSSPLQGNQSKYAFLVSVLGGPTNLPNGAFVSGFDMDGTGQNVAAFEVYTNQPIAQFSWLVLRVA